MTRPRAAGAERAGYAEGGLQGAASPREGQSPPEHHPHALSTRTPPFGLRRGPQADERSRSADRHPDIVAQARAARPALVVWAAVLRRADVVRLLTGLGFDINAKGRTDGVGNTEWETALHHAAGAGDLGLARTLVELGADPDIRDTRSGGTPLSWARHFDQEQTAQFLAPLTAAN